MDTNPPTTAPVPPPVQQTTVVQSSSFGLKILSVVEGVVIVLLLVSIAVGYSYFQNKSVAACSPSAAQQGQTNGAQSYTNPFTNILGSSSYQNPFSQ